LLTIFAIIKLAGAKAERVVKTDRMNLLGNSNEGKSELLSPLQTIEGGYL